LYIYEIPDREGDKDQTGLERFDLCPEGTKRVGGEEGERWVAKRVARGWWAAMNITPSRHFI